MRALAQLAKKAVAQLRFFCYARVFAKSDTSFGLSFALRPAKQRLKKVEWSERRVDQGNEVLARVRTTRLAGSESLLDEPLSRKIELP